VLSALWNRLLACRHTDAVERRAETQRPAEGRFVDESMEDRQADAAAGEWLGGIDPARLLDRASVRAITQRRKGCRAVCSS
jgi:hypothetical protein